MGLLEDLQSRVRGIIVDGKKSLYTTNPLLLKPTQAAPKPVFGVPKQPVRMPVAETATAQSTPQQTNLTAREMVDTTIKGGVEVAKFGKEVLQGTARTVGTVGITAGNLALPGQPFPSEIDPSGNAYSRAILGDTTVKDIPTYGQAGLDFIEETTGKKLPKGFAIPLAGLGIAADLSGGGKPVRRALEEVMTARKGAGMLIDTTRKVGNKKVYEITVDDLIAADASGYKELDNARVDFYKEKLSKGEPLEPLRVQAGDGNIFVEDGKHRLAAMRALGIDTAEVIDVTPPPKVVTPKPKTPKQFDIPKTPAGKVDVPTYVKQQTQLREAARGDKSLKTKTTEFLQNLENKMVDFTSPIQRRVDKAKKSDPLGMSTKSDIKDNIDRVFNAPAITSAFVKEKGFAKAVQSIDEADLDAFDQYLTAKHATDLNSKGIRTGRNAEADAALVAELGPKFENAAKEIQKYNVERLNYMVDSGLISKELKDSLLEKYPNYVPFQRVFSEDELANAGGFGSSGVASLSKQSVVQKIVGSEREIESPLESLLELTSKAVQQGEKNKAALTLTSYADIKGNPFGLRKITKTTDAAPDKSTISVLRDGKKEIWEVDTDVAKAAKALDVERMNILGKILAFPLRVARLGITGVNVPFVAANVVRDQMSAFIMSDKGLRSSIANPKVFLPALGNAIGHGKLYDEMLSEGALMTSFDVVRDSVKPTLKSVVADKSRVSKAMYIAKNPSQWFRAVEDAIGRSEEVTRMQQYLGNKQAALAEGATEAQARTIAARAARENSTNFARRGEWGTVMNNTILYLNAGIQGSRLLVRNLKNKPVKTTTKIATTLMLPAATITYWNLSDPERKKAYEDIQDYEKENNFIIVPPNPVKGEDGRWNVIKIPLPPGVGQFTNFVRRPIEASQGLDEVGFAEAAANLLRTVSPTDLSNPASSLTPQIIKPSIQAATNKNLFTGYDIVPKSMQDLPAEQQVKDTTSGTATDIARVLGTSPIKTEQFINDTLGGVGPQILNAADRIRGEEVVGGRSIPESVARRFNSAAGNKLEADQLEEIYNLRTEARGESNEIKKLADSTLAELRNMPKDQANIELKRIFDENRPLYNAINKARKAEERGLTKVEAALEDLPVKDGTRAAYIYSEFLEIQKSSPEDAQAYIVELRKKKIISDEVFKQLKELKELDQ